MPHPKSKDWKGHEYWRSALPDLTKAHNSVCAYCAQWISKPTGTPTVDHYIPVSVNPNLAYEWSNFRLACLALNTRKRDYRDVIDPFQLIEDWFRLDFDTFMIKPNPDLSDDQKKQICATLKRLKLNEDEAFIISRQEWFRWYDKGEITFPHLEKKAPFIAREMKRQGLVS
jgi:uncharacterized protein (TIGR02646 family)